MPSSNDNSMDQRPGPAPMMDDDTQPSSYNMFEGDDSDTEASAKKHELDSDKNVDLFRRLLSFYQQEMDRQYENRAQMAIDEDYYDGKQYTAEELEILSERGQSPLVYNMIKTSIDWITGSEKRSRSDFRILPRRADEEKAAEGKTNLLKYLSDCNRTPFSRSTAFEDQVKVGLGWMEVGVQDEDDSEPIYDRYENWRNIIYDSRAIESDLSDARYQFRPKWLDVDVAISLIPDRADMIRLSQTTAGYTGNMMNDTGDDFMNQPEEDVDGFINANRTNINGYERQRVQLVEAWYRTPGKIKRLKGGPLSGQTYNQNNPIHAEHVQTGVSMVVEKASMVMRCAVFCSGGLLFESASPYQHNRFPFIPFWGFRRGRDNMPYGMIRQMRDIQDAINKRASKALFILSTNKVLMEEGAVDDIETFREEVSRPDGVIVYKPGKRLELNADRDLAAAHLELMSTDKQAIQTMSGITDELLGRTTNAVSGVAINARQQQGSVATNKIFDNLRFSIQLHGELLLSLAEQFVTDQKEFRVTNQRGNPTYIQLNNGMPENDITRSKADFVISEQDWNASMRQAQTQQLVELLSKLPPQVQIVMLDLLVEMMDVPNRDEIVKRIRAVNGQQDPDATEPTPEMLAQRRRQAAAAQLAAAQAKAALDKIEAETADKQASAAYRQAQISALAATTINEKITATSAALLAGEEILMKPSSAKVGDALLVNAGWTNSNVESAVTPQMEQQAVQQPVQAPADPADPAAGPSQQQQQSMNQAHQGISVQRPEAVPNLPDPISPGTDDPTDIPVGQ